MQRLLIALGLYLIGRFLNIFSLFIASDFLHLSEVPIISATFYILTGSALILIILHNYWNSILFKNLTTSHCIVLLTNGFALLCSFTLFNYGLKYAGPVRALALNYADYMLLFLPFLLSGHKTHSSKPGPTVSQKRGMLVLIVAYVVLLTFPESSIHDPLTSSEGQPALHSVQLPSTNLVLSEGTWGTWALLLSTGLELLRKKYARRKSKDFGGRRKLHALSMLTAALFLLLPTIYQQYQITATTPSDVTQDSSSFLAPEIQKNFFVYLYLIVFYVLLDLYVESIGLNVAQYLGGPNPLASTSGTAATIGYHRLTRINCFFSLLIGAAFIDYIRGEGRFTPVSLWTSVAICGGLHVVIGGDKESIVIGKETHHSSSWLQSASSAFGFPSNSQTSSALPITATPTSAGRDREDRHISTRHELLLIWRHIAADGNTLRIFTFLVMNLAFMFVELIYGFWTNSLGLISDAGHMLFDCVALGIGLYASYVAKIKANSVYTYGYGRYEVLSAYINAVFLLFIGFFVFVEAVERIYDPPEIRSESLIVVSVLGFLVNLIGLFFFHDHGGHGHSHGGHGHSHGGHGGHGGHGSHGSHGGHGCGDHGHAHEQQSPSPEAGCDHDDSNVNVKVIFLHVLADALGSLGVILSSFLIHYFGWFMADAVCSIVISVLIVASVIGAVQSSALILLQATPLHKVKVWNETMRKVEQMDGVVAVHSRHLWSFTQNSSVATLHVQIKADAVEQVILNAINGIVKAIDPNGINICVQIEKSAFVQQQQHSHH